MYGTGGDLIGDACFHGIRGSMWTVNGDAGVKIKNSQPSSCEAGESNVNAATTKHATSVSKIEKNILLKCIIKKN